MYELEFRCYRITIHSKDFIVSNSSGSVNDSKQPAAVSLNVLSVFANALTKFLKCFLNGFATHFATVETH